MNYKGYCLWADDVPNPKAPHYIVITSSANPDDMVMVVAISSIKYKYDGSEKYYDKSCVLSVGDIVDDKGNSILTKPSFIRYEYAIDMKTKDILSNISLSDGTPLINKIPDIPIPNNDLLEINEIPNIDESIIFTSISFGVLPNISNAITA